MYQFFSTGIEILAASIGLIPVLLYLNRWLFPSLKRTAICGLFCLYLSAVYVLAGLPHILYVRYDVNLNLIPFAYMFSDLDTTVLNVLLFVPLGIFLPLLWESFIPWWKTTLFGFSLSLLVEFLQLFTYRATDVNDLMTNTLGAVLGWILARAILLFFPDLPSKNTKELTVLGILTFEVLFLIQPFASQFLWNCFL